MNRVILLNLLVSDFDDTLFFQNDMEQTKKNFLACREFMKHNTFVIATGRSFLDLKKDINFMPNYLVINHGATIIKDGIVLYNKTINTSILREIKDKLYLNKANSYFGCYGIENCSYDDIAELTKLHINYDRLSDSHQIYEYLNNNYSDSLNVFYSNKGFSIEIVDKEVSKSHAIKLIASSMGLDKSSIYVIGDSYTDTTMIADFNGYAVPNAKAKVKEVASKIYPSVEILIEDILRGANHE